MYKKLKTDIMIVVMMAALMYRASLAQSISWTDCKVSWIKLVGSMNFGKYIIFGYRNHSCFARVKERVIYDLRR